MGLLAVRLVRVMTTGCDVLGFVALTVALSYNLFFLVCSSFVRDHIQLRARPLLTIFFCYTSHSYASTAVSLLCISCHAPPPPHVRTLRKKRTKSDNDDDAYIRASPSLPSCLTGYRTLARESGRTMDGDLCRWRLL